MAPVLSGVSGAESAEFGGSVGTGHWKGVMHVMSSSGPFEPPRLTLMTEQRARRWGDEHEV